MNIFFTGCTHFDHDNIIKLCDRPFDHVNEMNEVMIQNWNNVVGPGDLVYHLGDFGFIKDRERATRLLGRLNGYKSLVIGNHDPLCVTNNACWYSVNSYLEIKEQDQRIVLFHYPIEDWNRRYKGSIHLHAHTHGKDFVNPLAGNANTHVGNTRFNVGVDACNFTPVALDTILEASK